MNDFYNHSTFPAYRASGSSSAMRAELDLITAGFDKLPTLTGNGSKHLVINSGATAVVASTLLTETGTGIGIGVPSPTVAFDVAGNAKFTQASGTATTLTLAQTGVVNWTLTNTATTGLFSLGNGTGFAFQSELVTSGVRGVYVKTDGSVYFGLTAAPDSANGGSGFVNDTFSRKVLYLATTTTLTANLAFFINGNNGVGSISTSGTSTAYNTSSDARLKEAVAPAGDSGSVIDQVLVRTFRWKTDGAVQRFGFVAQELDKVFPEAVRRGDDGPVLTRAEDTWAVDNSKLVPLLVSEIQQLRRRVAALEKS